MEAITETRSPEIGHNLIELSSFPESHRKTIEARIEEVAKIINQTVPPELLNLAVPSISFESAVPEMIIDEYSIEAVALCEQDGSVKVFEGFFTKNYAEQQYVLTHEIAHALSSRLFSNQESYEELSRLNQLSIIEGETAYTRHVMKQKDTGKLESSAVFDEQTAERLTAFLLGGGEIANILEVQALHLENPSDIFEGFPVESRADKESLANYLARGKNLSPIIRDTVSYQELFDKAINGEADDDEEYITWEQHSIDTTLLASSPLVESYVSHQQSVSEPTSIWRFLFELFFKSDVKAN